MKESLPLRVVLFSVVLFTILFFKQALGLNLLIYEFTVFGWLYLNKEFELKERNTIGIFIGVILTAFFTVLHHSTLSFVANFGLFILFIGVITAPEIKSLVNILGLSITNIFMSLMEFIQRIKKRSESKKSVWYRFWRLRIFIIPIAIVILFSTFYSLANPEFGKIVTSFWLSIYDALDFIFVYIDFTIIGTLAIGLVFSTFIFLRVRNKIVSERDSSQSDVLIRKRVKRERNIKNLALKNEYRSALFLFIALNILIFVLNIMDLNHVWLNFEWKGQMLKDFVHIGTYILIFAIVVSIALVLYFFRSNLNFFKNNAFLKVLCYIWIAQNVFLTISVGIRSWYYIEYFALAYKRIAIIFFLILTIYGLISVFIKVKDGKSNSYLTKNNFAAWILVLVIASAFNWDTIIAKYNFSNSNKSFVHLNYLSNLSNSALPYLERPTSELEKIDTHQELSFFKSLEISSSMYRNIYMTPISYLAKIKSRKKYFMRKWEAKGILEWNYAEYKAYNQLKAQLPLKK